MSGQEVAVYDLPLQGREERRKLYEWMAAEEEYVAAKFDDQRDEHDGWLRRYDVSGWWEMMIQQYLDRANQFLWAASNEVDSKRRRALELRAQQAIGKAMMTCKGLAESAIRVYGPMPKGGVASGEIDEG